MNQQLQAVRGMNDLLPEQMADWHRVESVLRETGWAYGYQEIRTPIVEKAELFAQSIGDQTDIVEKEMYTFIDSGKEILALRPEATASTVRACSQHGLLHNKQQRLWYMGPMFRRERPQKGRYRQFHQFGIEAFGWPGPDIDAEVICVGARIWKRLKISDIKLEINTLGSLQSRLAYRQALQAYFSDHQDQLDRDSLRRLTKNPLRILDSKVAATMEIVKHAPDILTYLDSNARSHFDGLCESLCRSGIEFRINPRLVRGLDYYTSTVFEWITDKLGAQSAVCAGGRYDGLVEKHSGKSTPAVGFAMGIERLVELIRLHNVPVILNVTDVYVASATTAAHGEAVKISEMLRDAGFTVITHCGESKLKNQMKRADLSGARIAVITGLAESTAGSVQVKPLRNQDDNGNNTSNMSMQHQVSVDALVDWCRHNN